MSDTTPDELNTILDAATAATEAFSSAAPATRAGWLRAAADALDANSEKLVELAMAETNLPNGRLTGEVARSSGQIRMFADALESGWLLELMVETADPDYKPVPRPDLRRTLVTVGPVLVFGASNFPFAFSVAGGDVAAALAAGSPVVVKAHPGHLETSRATAEVIATALAEAGAPAGVFALIEGFEVGTQALTDPRIKASAFTGSVPAGLALHKIAANRDEPIPFYGELGSVNPVFVLPGAIAEKMQSLAEGYAGSLSLGVGQFCTSPGITFAPAGSGFAEAAAKAAGEIGAADMLNSKIAEGYAKGAQKLRQNSAVEVLTEGSEDGLSASPTVLRTDVKTLLENRDELIEECFGPLSIVAEYADTDELSDAIDAFGGNLTATVHQVESDNEIAAKLLPKLADKAGRVLFNGWPTGVAVSWAQTHGGPFPSTVGTNHTSVGVTAARRFMRPVTFQDTPDALLPDSLKDANPLGLQRNYNGVDGTR